VLRRVRRRCYRLYGGTVTHAEALSELAGWCTAGEDDYRDTIGSTPARWRALIAERGPLGACQWVLLPHPEAWWLKTLTPLYEAKRLEWSVEYFAAYRPEGALLFTPDEINVARKRLDALGYKG
jgi:hypothetical protein